MHANSHGANVTPITLHPSFNGANISPADDKVMIDLTGGEVNTLKKLT